jgi:hypothetical protein
MRPGQFVGVLLIAAGALIAVLCGACTAFVIVAGYSPTGSGNPDEGGMTGLALVLGGVPTLFGCLMIWSGVVLLRSGRNKPPPVEPDTFD